MSSLMTIAKMAVISSVALFVATAASAPSASPQAGAAPTFAVAALDKDVRSFLEQELSAHLAGVTSLDPAPAAVLGAQTTGEYTWGTFMRSLAAYAQMSGASQLAGRDLARTIAEIGLLEGRLGGTRFSQMYAALSLRHYGADLTQNRLWQTLTPAERTAWTGLLDATKFYDPVKRQVINLPENYLGVASRIAAIAYDSGLLKDKTLLDSLLDRAAVQFTSGALYADDALPTGRYDRYSNEYARYVWDAAQIAKRSDILAALRPSLHAQMKLWWDLVSEDGYGYPWGRSLGVVSYMDTLEIAGFLAINPEFRPAPLPSLAAAYACAWRALRSDYKSDRHLLSIFDFGRGNYAYISRDREWQQTVGFLGKLAHAHLQLMSGWRETRLDSAAVSPGFSPVARFEFFRRGDRPAGVWIVRRDGVQFALPFTTGTKPGVADYLPAPHGLRGIAAPVEQVVPALVPFLELEDGRTIVATDGADAIEPSPDGTGVRARWIRWAQVGAKPGQLVDPGLQSEVEWKLDGGVLSRRERLTATAPVRVRRWRVIVPVTGSTQSAADRTGLVSVRGREGDIGVRLTHADWQVASSTMATGNDAAGRGARGAIPLLLAYESAGIDLQPGAPKEWRLDIVAVPSGGAAERQPGKGSR